MSKVNIELLTKVRDKIASTPEAYDQGTFGRPENAAPCGTAACIAGWTCLLSGAMDAQTLYGVAKSSPLAVQDRAAELLRLDDEDATVLFTEEPEGEDFDPDEEWNGDYAYSGWPAPFGRDWYNARRSGQLEIQAPKIAVAYLDHIIETGSVLDYERD